MSYDPATVAVKTASESAASNSVMAVPCLIHKVCLRNTNGSNAVSIAIYDAATATGTAKIDISTNLADGTAYELSREITFDPPVRFDTGVSTTVAGSNATARIHFTPA